MRRTVLIAALLVGLIIGFVLPAFSTQAFIANFLKLTGGTLTGNLLMSGGSITQSGGSVTITGGGNLSMDSSTYIGFNQHGRILSDVQTGITAHAGGGQGSATIICGAASGSEFTTVNTVGTTADSVGFAAPNVGQHCWVKNKGANSMNLFPQSGGQLCVTGAGCLTANTATAVAANATLECWSESSTIWNCR